MILYRNLLLILPIFVILACEQAEPNKEIEATAINGGATTIISDSTSKQPSTTIAFKDSVHNFGTINEGEVVEHEFSFTNTGTHPLVISDAKASCGCTIPEWTKDPVMPGSEGKLKVKYNSTGKEGKINKSISVYANTVPEMTNLKIEVEVKTKDKTLGPFNK
jgi:hypothetical protein